MNREQKQELAEKLLNLMGIREQFEKSIEESMHLFAAIPGFEEKMRGVLSDHTDNIFQIQIEIYADYFEGEELQRMVEIYSDPTMKRWRDSTQHLTTMVDARVREYMKEKVYAADGDEVKSPFATYITDPKETLN